MNKKKILFVNPHQFGHTAGYYYYCKYLRDDFDITFICFDKGLERISLDGIKIKYIHTKKNKLLRILYFLFQSIKESYNSRYNVLFVYSFYFSFIIGFFSRSRKKILDIRTGSLSTNLYKRLLQNKFIKLQTFFFDKIIVLSKDLIKLLDLPKSKSHFLPLGSEVYFNGMHKFEKLNLLYVGTLNKRNIDQTVKGLYIYLKSENFINNITYTIIGFGNELEEKKLRNIIKELKLENYINFVGRKSYNELSFYFEKNNIGISWIPKIKVFDLQPATKTFEYLLSGLFCIATSTKANSDLINKNNGILCDDTAESFAQSLKIVNKYKLKYKSNKIRNSVKNFTWYNLVKTNLLPYLTKE